MDNSFRRTAFKNTNFKDLLTVWECLCGDSPEDYESVVEGKRVRQKLDRLMLEPKNLGLITRLICLQEWLGCSQQELFDKSLQYYADSVGLSPTDDSLPSPASKPRMLRLTTSQAPAVLDTAFKEGITLWVNETIRSRGDNQQPDSKVSIGQLFDEPYCGVTAIEQFWRIVHELNVMTQPLSNRFSSSHLDEKAAQRTIHQLEELESRQSGVSNSPVVVNVVCSGAWCRGSAFAHYLSEHYMASEPDTPVLVLPLCRQGQSRALRDIIHPYDTLDFPHLVGWLSKFYEHGNSYNLDSEEFSFQLHSISDEIHNIRLKMLTRPATIIFDGVSASQQHRTPLERVIADDDIFWFLSRLTDAPICSIENPVWESNYKKNRFVLITDKKISDDYYRKTQFRMEETDAILLPRVSLNERLGALGDMNLKNAPQLKAFIVRNPILATVQSDCIFRLLDSILTVVKAGELYMESTIEPWFFSKPSSETYGESWLVQRCVSTLMESLDCLKPAYSTLLGLISSAPDGVRPASVKRFSQRLNALSLEQAELLPGIDLASVDATLEELLDLLGPILRQRGHDDFAGIDDVRLEMFSQSLAISDTHSNSKLKSGSNVIQFRMPQIMGAIRTYTAKHSAPGFHLVHRLLAEEAVVQQTTALTHIDVGSSLSIRSWRRLLSVIYHGLQSLPISQEKGGFVCIDPNEFESSQFSPHGDGYQYWIWLYFFWYRRMLERAPAWNLSRAYGLDGLKVELLECFDKPWRLWPVGLSQKQYFANSARPIKGLFIQQNMTKDHVKYFVTQRRSLARARIALSQLPEANQAIYDIKNLLALHGDERELAGVRRKQKKPEHAVEGRWIMDPGYQRTVALSISKQVFDAALLTFDDDVNHLFSELLKEFIPKNYHELSNLLTSRCEKHLRYLLDNSGDVWSRSLSSNNEKIAEQIIDELSIAGWAVGEIASVVDILFRLGERHGIAAEIHGVHKDLISTLDTGVMDPPSSSQTFHRTSGLIAAYVVFEFAEAVRLQLFRKYPNSSEYFASGHSGRQMIRSALALEGVYRRMRQAGDVGIGTYGQRAILSIKTIARHMFRYPRERASLTIIEAALFRTVGNAGTPLVNLMTSQRLLRHAEPIVLGLGRTTRVRHRLALERAKVNQAIALCKWKEQYFDFSEVQRHMSLSRIDIEYLERNHYNLPLWEALYERQYASWKSAGAELGVT